MNFGYILLISSTILSLSITDLTDKRKHKKKTTLLNAFMRVVCGILFTAKSYQYATHSTELTFLNSAIAITLFAIATAIIVINIILSIKTINHFKNGG